ncbi:septum formation protein Maf [Cyphellophora europaea CBS 101466]|uniref:Septum formation protein Maf n=1 Tax=Cyphellophora europaea (strain CBS 101466) TaxID=1220924 RepID=W2RP19_CYPE1|nr:septum formation protein Maf [Cyphellophora europaea CBS 101466]ETN38070.1 septum formation protein Maf [Cyphellophora europaea CBS 101466]
MSQPNYLDDPPSYDASSTNAKPRDPSQTPSNSTIGPTNRLPRPPPLQLPALQLLRNKRVLLGSLSPRRRQLLAQIGLTNIEVVGSNFAENIEDRSSPFEYVLATATAKAMAVYKQEADNDERGEPGLIIAADTIVVHANGDILEKPRSEVEHITMLKSLRDCGFHRVYTAVAMMMPLASARDPGYALETATEETLVKFDPDVTDELLLAYVRTREGADKAGGYGIQGTGAILVERIEGSFDNVVGLPLRATLKLIEQVVEKADDEDMLDGEGDLDEAE